MVLDLGNFDAARLVFAGSRNHSICYGELQRQGKETRDFFRAIVSDISGDMPSLGGRMRRIFWQLTPCLAIFVTTNGCAPGIADRLSLDPAKCVTTRLTFTEVRVHPSKIAFPDNMTAYGNQMIRLKLNIPDSANGINVIREFTLDSSNGWSRAPATCGLGQGLWEKPAVYCDKELGGHMSVRVAFEPETVQQPELRTEALAAYVEREVLCDPIQ